MGCKKKEASRIFPDFQQKQGGKWGDFYEEQEGWIRNKVTGRNRFRKRHKFGGRTQEFWVLVLGMPVVVGKQLEGMFWHLAGKVCSTDFYLRVIGIEMTFKALQVCIKWEEDPEPNPEELQRLEFGGEGAGDGVGREELSQRKGEKITQHRIKGAPPEKRFKLEEEVYSTEYSWDPTGLKNRKAVCDCYCRSCVHPNLTHWSPNPCTSECDCIWRWNL